MIRIISEYERLKMTWESVSCELLQALLLKDPNDLRQREVRIRR